MKGNEIVNRLKNECKNTVKSIASNSEELILQKETTQIFGQIKSFYKVSIKYNLYDVGWVINDHNPCCLRCNSYFGIFNWRHHCRKCGYLICGSCGSNKVVILALKSNNSRCCDICFQKEDVTIQQSAQCDSFDNNSNSNIHSAIIKEVVNSSSQLHRSHKVVTSEPSSVIHDAVNEADIDDVSSKSILGLYLIDTESGKSVGTLQSSAGQGSMDVSDEDEDSEEEREGTRSTSPMESGSGHRVVSYRGEGDNWQTVYQQQLQEEREEEDASHHAATLLSPPFINGLNSGDDSASSNENRTESINDVSVSRSLDVVEGQFDDADGVDVLNGHQNIVSKTSPTSSPSVEQHVTTLANLTPITSRRILETALHNGGVWEADSDADSLASTTPNSIRGGQSQSVTPVTVSRSINRVGVEKKSELSVSRSSVFADIVDEDGQQLK